MKEIILSVTFVLAVISMFSRPISRWLSKEKKPKKEAHFHELTAMEKQEINLGMLPSGEFDGHS